MDETKPAIRSLGMLAPAIGMVAMGLSFFGFSISAEEQATLSEGITTIVEKGFIVGTMVVGMWGRWRASSRISGVVSSGEAS